MRSFVFTCGDINGIGPEIAIKTLNKISADGIAGKKIFICPFNVFEKIGKVVPPEFKFGFYEDPAEIGKGEIGIISPGEVSPEPGVPTAESGQVAFEAIRFGFELVSAVDGSVLITSPISKHALKLAGVDFPGHTEMLGAFSGSNKFVMTFLSEGFIGALATIHIPVKEVSASVTGAKLTRIIETVRDSLNRDFGKRNYKIAVLGLNPHAGEEGRIGDEEINVIKPVIEKLDDYYIQGPFVPDAFFARKSYEDFDAVIAMYHDQLLIPFKMLYPFTGVNFTAGLDIIRTSPDHGTAFDIAWQNKADENSLLESYKWGAVISDNRAKHAKK